MRRLRNWLVASSLLFSLLLTTGCQMTVLHVHIGDTEALVEATGSLNPTLKIPLPSLPTLTPPSD